MCERLKYARRLWFRAFELNVDFLVIAKVLFTKEDGSHVARFLVVKI